MSTAYWLNTAWMWKCRRELKIFQSATRSVAATQEALLREILRANRHSEFGRAHGFDAIESSDEFQRRVPLADYQSYHSAIERIAAGASNVLTTEPVQLLEPTSGSSGGEKLIPYTASLRAQFQRGIAAWLGDLLYAYPAARRGRAYWSISPALGDRRISSGGIPIGFADDSAYLARVERFALKRLLAIPPHLAKISDLDQFRYQTLLHLLAAEDIALISIWSPTFVTALLTQLEKRGGEFCRDLRELRLSGADSVNASQPRQRLQRLHQRADDLEAIFESRQSVAAKLRRIWPRLTLISCWADGASARYLAEVKELFPNVVIQPKGLLATEGFVSFPLARRAGSALALRSHLFEFVDDVGEIRLAHQLEYGKTYQVAITTGGGLYRYQLGDIVEVVGFENQCPLVRFVGRGDGVCDLVGEKVSETQVRLALAQAFAENGMAPQFAMLVPVEDEQRGYRLYVQGRNGELSAAKLATLRSKIEATLAENPYYDYALRIGQLAKLQVHSLSSSAGSAWTVYERECLKRGQKLGDIKPMVLHSWTGWAHCLEPLTEARSQG